MDYEKILDPSVLPTRRNKILCCDCGAAIDPNPSNMCVVCIRSRVDITEGIPKQVVIYMCRGCERYLQSSSTWVHAALESKELLSLCLKKLKGLDKLKLVDAAFVWTEPHSRRIKVKLNVHGTLESGAVLQQIFIVEYMVNHKMCDDCHRVEAKDYWKALVQVRQRAENKKTIYYLEQLILKHKAQSNTSGIKPENDGLDFYYATEAYARKFLDFVRSVLPIRYTHSKKQISHDIHSNLYNYKFTYCIDIVPVSRDNLVCLPKKLTGLLGSISSICLVYKVSNSIHLIDPSAGQIAEVNSNIYWRYPFENICSPRQLVKYFVVNIEPIMDKDRRFFPGQGSISNKHVMADCWVVKECELGVNENLIHIKTHLGGILNVGDIVLAYNLIDSNINNRDFERIDNSKVPDVILVKKYYDHTLRRRKRNWKLQHLTNSEEAHHLEGDDYIEFLDELDEDPNLRQNVNIFKDSSKTIPVDLNDVEDETAPYVTLEEMLDDLVIEDVEMEEDEIEN